MDFNIPFHVGFVQDRCVLCRVVLAQDNLEVVGTILTETKVKAKTDLLLNLELKAYSMTQ